MLSTKRKSSASPLQYYFYAYNIFIPHFSLCPFPRASVSPTIYLSIYSSIYLFISPTKPLLLHRRVFACVHWIHMKKFWQRTTSFNGMDKNNVRSHKRHQQQLLNMCKGFFYSLRLFYRFITLAVYSAGRSKSHNVYTHTIQKHEW